VQSWQILGPLNLLAILPLFPAKSRGAEEQRSRGAEEQGRIKNQSSNLPILQSSNLRAEGPLSAILQPSAPLLLILLIALLLRTLNLDYSEFQGDESLAMIAAARGRALFARQRAG
jgi:hypothetical protein